MKGKRRPRSVVRGKAADGSNAGPRTLRGLVAVVVAAASVSAVIAILVLLGIVGGANARGRSAAGGLPGSNGPPPVPVVSLDLPLPTVLAGARPSLVWPAKGQGAVFVAGSGMVAASPGEHPVPIASVTKIMTALIVLLDHPLAGVATGPVFTMTEAEVLAFERDSANGDSNLAVTVGEHLNELQLLEALLIPSADNIANYLARWDAGNIPAFVAKMNAEASALGLAGTHYSDASGLAPTSVSTAADMAKLASVAMANPAFAGIVVHRFVTMPTGNVWNYNPLVGYDGIVGVKSGFTTAAGGCLVIAADREVAGHTVLVVVASLGQPGGVLGAARADQSLLDAMTPSLEPAAVLAAGTTVGSVSATWSKRRVPVVTSAALTVVGWPGMALSYRLVPASPLPPASAVHGAKGGGSYWRSGTPLGVLEAVNGTTVVASVAAVAAANLPAPPTGS